MVSNSPPGIRLTGIRASIPQGYILGRVSAGIGGVELISVGKAQSAGLIPVTLPPSGPAGGDLSGTYPNPTVAKINTQPLPAPASSAHQVLMYSGTALAWVNQHLDGGSTGQVATKNSGTDFDISWGTPHYLIAGGTTGQVLTKNSNTDYDVSWQTPSAGGGGGASSFWLDGTDGYVGVVDSNGLLVLDSMGRGVYSKDPTLPTSMIPVLPASLLTAAPLPKGYRFGGTTANNAVTPNTKIDIGAGAWRDSTNAVNIVTGGTLTIDATTTGANGLDTGSLANTSYYFTFVIMKPDGTTASLASLSSSAPTLPSGYSYFRRVGAVRTDGSAHFIPYLQIGNKFKYSTVINDYSLSNQGTSAVVLTLSVPPIVVTPIMVVNWAVTSGSLTFLMSAISDPDNAPSFTPGSYNATGSVTLSSAGGTFIVDYIPTNTSRQLRIRSNSWDTGQTMNLMVAGWADPFAD